MQPGRKAVFLDVDGTYVNDRGVVPPSAEVAVRAARANGHLVFLCTGRSPSDLWDHVKAAGFDGLIAAAGAYVELAGEVLIRRYLPTGVVTEVVQFFEELGIEYLLETNDGLFGSPNARAQLHQLVFAGVADEAILAELERGVGPFLASVRAATDPTALQVNKISFLHSDVPLEVVQRRFAAVLNVIPGTVAAFGANSGELAAPGVHKAAGIALVLDRLGIDPSETIAFGDAANDFEMLQFVGTGIAMASAYDALKAVADDITADPDDDGIALGFRKLGLIDA